MSYKGPVRVATLTWVQYQNSVSIYCSSCAEREPVVTVQLMPNGEDGGLEAIVEQTIDAIRKRFDYADLEKAAP